MLAIRSTQKKDGEDGDVRVHHVRVRDRGLLRDVVDADVLGRVHEQVDDRLRPIRAVAQEAEVTQRLLRTPELSLDLAEFV